MLPTDAPHLAEKSGPIAMAMSPLLWAQHRPDCFDTYSAGIVLLQLTLPFLRNSSGLVRARPQWRRAAAAGCCGLLPLLPRAVA